jgi:hypothetical protein
MYRRPNNQYLPPRELAALASAVDATRNRSAGHLDDSRLSFLLQCPDQFRAHGFDGGNCAFETRATSPFFRASSRVALTARQMESVCRFRCLDLHGSSRFSFGGTQFCHRTQAETKGTLGSVAAACSSSLPLFDEHTTLKILPRLKVLARRGMRPEPLGDSRPQTLFFGGPASPP